jgi:hypothetical protein
VRRIPGLGTADFIVNLERRLGRPITRLAPGRQPVIKAEAQSALF